MRFDIKKINLKLAAFILAVTTICGVLTLSVSASVVTSGQTLYSETLSGSDIDIAALSLSTRSSGYEEAKAAIIKSCSNFESTCSIKDYGISLDEVETIMSEIMDQYEFYYFNSYNYSHYSNGIATAVYPKYSATKSEVEAASKEIDAIAAKKPDDITDDIDIALWLHDYICLNFEYDTTYENHGVNEMLRDGRGVCQAYADLYGLLLERFGIESYYISSDAMNHAWNIVNIDGEWYHVDVTWDDPIPDRTGRARHEYFLRSDAKITELKHNGWESDIKCTSTKYDGDLLAVSDCPLVWSNGKWYCADSAGGKIYQIDLKNDSQKLVYTCDSEVYWQPNGPSSSYIYLEKYLTLCAYDGELYFNGPNDIYRLDPESGVTVKVHSYTGGDACIFNIVADTDCIRYYTYANINDPEDATAHSFVPAHTHNYKDGVCSCGEYEDGIGATLAGYTLSLDGRIGVNFYMELVSSVAASTDAYLQFTLPDSTTENVRVADAEKKTVSGKTYYVFSCHINAYDMTDDVTAQVVNGSSRGSVYTFTVADYAYYIIDNPNVYSADDIKFAKALLNYGTAAQNYFDVSTDTPANKDLSASERNIDTLTPSDLEKYHIATNVVESIGSFAGFSLVLGSQTTLRVYFEPDDDVDITLITFKINGTTVTAEKCGKYYRIAADGINAGELGDNLEFSATDGDKVLTQNYSAMSYCYAILSQDTDDDVYTEELKTMLSALYVYMNAASIYG